MYSLHYFPNIFPNIIIKPYLNYLDHFSIPLINLIHLRYISVLIPFRTVRYIRDLSTIYYMVNTMICEICGRSDVPLEYHIIRYAPLQYRRLCKTCHKIVHGRFPILLEIFRDYYPIVNGKGQFGRYNQKFIIVPKSRPAKITLGKLKIYVATLQKRFPDKNFILKKKQVGRITYYILTKKRYDKHGNLQRDIVPLWFDIENQKVWIEERVVKKMPKLANYIIMVTLGALGISQSKYYGGA